MAKAILNYTTTIGPDRSVAEIHRMLSAHGASHVMVEYGPDRGPVGIAFRIATPAGERSFKLPARIDGVRQALERPARARKIPPRLATREQAARVAWRIVAGWISSQLAMIEAELITLDEVMLPYLMLEGGRPLYEVMKDRRLSLPSPG